MKVNSKYQIMRWTSLAAALFMLEVLLGAFHSVLQVKSVGLQSRTPKQQLHDIIVAATTSNCTAVVRSPDVRD